ncbi:hypothetical protein SAMN00017405_0730 [Desulfonispora thiosulfatigenes DSM 11270]|uniref:Uncharacterized protein n=1 Tax=Desulfonispora thiosulfatigenes DSM 11270 TaxID=656914 RepID=A0A1W1UDH8_DESTI|nr:hypothetical protein [Desulfonispora thiosulfatigenes]SMB79148.1 hypothetical protein SAMN00017405_0730 [Desulfonispora thiosulfatigenes DSM 11270]
MLNDIIEKRAVTKGLHSLVLEIPVDEYNKVYNQFNNEVATEILNHHLENRGDDGRPSDIEIQHEDNNIVTITANVHYLGNDHTTYKYN